MAILARNCFKMTRSLSENHYRGEEEALWQGNESILHSSLKMSPFLQQAH